MFCNDAALQLTRSSEAREAGQESISLETKVIEEMPISIPSNQKDVKQPLARLCASRRS
jgi:hypothetical protein